MSEPHEYYTFTPEKLIPEGRRVYALEKAIELSDMGVSPDEVLRLAKVFETYLESPKPKLKAIKE